MQASKRVLKGRRLSITDSVRCSPHRVEMDDNASLRLVSKNGWLLDQQFVRPKVLHAECNWWRRDGECGASKSTLGGATWMFRKLVACFAYTILLCVSD
jgi:hypothetical protein